MSPLFKVTAHWDGDAELEIEADDENRAEEKAREIWVGFYVAGGHVDCEIDDVEQI